MQEIKTFLPRNVNLIKRTVLGKNTLVEQY